ncbi:MAG: ion channel [Pseudomonadota bacterium]
MAGSIVLCTCALFHSLVLMIGVDFLEWLHGLSREYHAMISSIEILIGGFLTVLVGHTIQVWVWALNFRLSRAIGALDEAVYFSLVTTTTLGYGDVTLDRNWRVFGAMAAVSGLLTYGLSTAYLVSIVERMLATRIG